MTDTRTKLVQKALIAVILVSVAVAGAALVSPTPSALCTDCDVIYISIDTLGYKHTSLYDPSLATTPFLKQLADERGVVFEHAYTQSSWTLPSHVSLLTGEQPWDMGVWLVPDKVPERAYSIAEAFKDAGRQTAAFSNGGFVQPEWGYDQGFELFEGSMEEREWNDLPSLFTKGLSWIKDETDPERDFFLFLRPFHVHDPHGTYGMPGTLGIEDIVEVNTKEGGPTPEDARALEERYRVGVREADEALRELWEGLEREGRADSTILVITADHGEEFGEHGVAGFHATALYNESIQVPLVFIVPGVEARRIEASVGIGDVPKTILGLVGLRSGELGGQSLLSYIEGTEIKDRIVLSATAQGRDHVFATVVESYRGLPSFAKEHPPEERRIRFQGPYASSAIQGRWHLIRNMDGGMEVYDMENDPPEQENLWETRDTLPYEDRATITELTFALQTIRP